MEPPYLAILAGGLVGAAVTLMLASLLDVPALRIVAVGLILVAFAAREVDRWGRRLPLVIGALLLAIGAGYALARLS